mmetsp:Transcript_53280/g.105943  ORF Transcript_53280/g.105943 Transcript_53280/m.105943 type:complete len:271 (+) Transcript_53280:133-945(+)
MAACHNHHQDLGQTVVPSEGHGRCYVVVQGPKSVLVLHPAAARWHPKLSLAAGLLQQDPDHSLACRRSREQAVHHSLRMAEDHLRGHAQVVEHSHCHNHKHRHCRRRRSCRPRTHQHKRSVQSHTSGHKLARSPHSYRPGCSHLVPIEVAAVLDGAEAVAAAARAAWCGDGASVVTVSIGAVVACPIDVQGASVVASDLDVLEADQGKLEAANHVVASDHAVAVGQDCPRVVVHQQSYQGHHLRAGFRPHFGLPQMAHGHLQSHGQRLNR